jgi:glycosyltransferase involved in cell wall biosynthesis
LSSTYDFEFGPNTPYQRAYELVLGYATPGGLIVDLGCGHGALGEPLADAGFTYVGLDVDESSLEHVRQRGHEAATADLTDSGSLQSAIEGVAADRPISAFLAIDVFEHLPSLDEFLRSFRPIAIEQGRPPLIVSIPNAAHFDVGAKLLHGRWDATETGLLDKTHLGFFTEERLTDTLAGFGWNEVGRADFELHRSDQHFPVRHPGIAVGSTLGQYLRKLRSSVDSFGEVNQFVRAYSCGDVVPQPQEEPDRPGLTVIMRTQGTRLEILGEALLSLAGQSDDNFEVRLMVHTLTDETVQDVRQIVGPFAPSFGRRVYIHSVSGGDRSRPLNEGLRVAAGKYVAFLDDDDLVTSEWVETFLKGAEKRPGAVVRAVTADQAARRTKSKVGYEVLSGAVVDPARIDFSYVRHLETNRTPICAFAVPMDAVKGYSLEFDEELTVLEDWHFFLRAAGVCGVHNVPRVTSIYRRWDDEEATWHTIDREVWADTRRSIQLELDANPILLPKGSASAIARLIERAFKAPDKGEIRATNQRAKELQRELKVARRRVAQLENSTSWKVTRPLRAVTSVFKRTPSSS